jgi:hypothetical protein
MLSYSGVKYTIDEPPPLRDAVVALARIPRWCGAMAAPWSVLQHSLVVADLLRPRGVEWELAGLSHDLEEGLGWGDISSALKPKSIRDAQQVQRSKALGKWLGFPLGDQRRYALAALWKTPELKEADLAAADAERYLAIDGLGRLDSDPRPLHCKSLMLMSKYGYSMRGSGWSAAEQVQYFLSEFERLSNALHSLWPLPSSPVQRPVAASTSSPGDGVAIDHGSYSVLVNEPAAAGASLGGVVGIDRSSLFRCAEEYTRVCSVCGVEYPDSACHACHPEAVGPTP